MKQDISRRIFSTYRPIVPKIPNPHPMSCPVTENSPVLLYFFPLYLAWQILGYSSIFLSVLHLVLNFDKFSILQRFWEYHRILIRVLVTSMNKYIIYNLFSSILWTFIMMRCRVNNLPHYFIKRWDWSRDDEELGGRRVFFNHGSDYSGHNVHVNGK